jgi:hypothetical protein
VIPDFRSRPFFLEKARHTSDKGYIYFFSLLYMSRKKPSPQPRKKDHVISEPSKIIPFQAKMRERVATMQDRLQKKKRELLNENSFIGETKTFFHLFWKKLGGDVLNNAKKLLFIILSWFWRISVFLLGLSNEGATFWGKTPWIVQVLQSFFSTIAALFVLFCFRVYVPRFIKNCRNFSLFSFNLEKDIRDDGLITRGILLLVQMWDWTFIKLSKISMYATCRFLSVVLNFGAKLANPDLKKIDYESLWAFYLKILNNAGINNQKKEKKKPEDEEKKG